MNTATYLAGPPTWARSRAVILLLALLAAPAAWTGSPVAADRKVLSVTGNVERPRDFTLNELEGLGVVELVTETPFTKGEIRFVGVPLQRLLETVGASGETISAIALNDYSVDIPRHDGIAYGVVLATRVDGKPLPVRDKGPVWVVYPWSKHPELNGPVYKARSIWQVRSLEIR